jgi:hypothetical protein
MSDIEELVGRILIRVDMQEGESRVVFHCLDGAAFTMQHTQDCCESVYLHEIAGDLHDLHGLVTEAYEASNDGVPALDEYTESFTWTFYVISTRHGVVTLRWYGSSNGYYSERVDFMRVS